MSFPIGRTDVQVKNESWQKQEKVFKTFHKNCQVRTFGKKISMFTHGGGNHWAKLCKEALEFGETMSKHKQAAADPIHTLAYFFRFSSSSSCYSGVQLSTESVVVAKVLARLHAGPRLSHPEPPPSLFPLPLLFNPVRRFLSWLSTESNRTPCAIGKRKKKTFLPLGCTLCSSCPCTRRRKTVKSPGSWENLDVERQERLCRLYLESG